jgi:glycosyltransferase involved in cell wall biosynthesis
MRPGRATQHVLFATAYFPPYAPGGAEHSTEALALALQERGLQVTVATPRLGPLEHPSQRVIMVDAGLRLRDGKELVRSRTFLRPDVQLRLALGYSRAIRAAGATIVHCQNVAVLPAAFLAARLRRVPIVVTVRDLGAVCPLAVCLLSQARVPHDCGVVALQRRCVDEYCHAYGTRRLRTRLSSLVGFAVARIRARLLRHADARIFVGTDLASLHRDAGLIGPGASVHVTGNIAAPVTAPAADHDGEGRYAVYAGKISVGKGFGVLLDALPQIQERCGDFRLVCFGRADESWQRRIAANPSIDYRGSVAHASVLDAYRGARMAVVPSVWPEPLPRAVLEAQSAGVPVVATRSGGIADAVSDESDGLLVAPGDPEALAHAVTRLWDDEALRSRLAGNGRLSVVRRFSADAVCTRTVAAYDEALGLRKREEIAL